MEILTAEGTLRRARHFLGRAVNAAGPDPLGMRYDLEAAIVFARSVTFHLQKELSDRPGFVEWYANIRSQLEQDPVARFLLEVRNLILKQGPAPVARQIVAVINEAVELDEALQIRVKRGTPWYRRSSRILLEDAFRPLRDWQARREHEREAAARRAQRDLESESPAPKISVVFATPPLQGQSVFAVIDGHLSVLETIVTQARERF
jgi:hypothetical protein